MNWFGFLNPGSGPNEDSTRRNPRNGHALPRDAEGHVRAFLPRFAACLKESVETFNQSADTRLYLEAKGEDERVDAVRLQYDGTGFMFTAAGGGVIRVDRFHNGTKVPYALLRPRLNGTGDLQEWREQQLFEGGQTVRRGPDELCEHYLLHTVRARLLANM
jgi:hypothetical protein